MINSLFSKSIQGAIFGIAASVFCSTATATATATAQGTRPQGQLWIEANDGTQNLGSVFDFGMAHDEGAIEHSLVVTNHADVAVTNLVGTILNPHFRFKGGRFPGEGGSCEKALPAHESCTIVMAFLPTEVGSKRGVVRINYWEGSVPSTSYRPLAGERLL